MHPYAAERKVRGFVENDRAQLRELADLFDPDIPIQENKPYVEKAREFIDRAEEVMTGRSKDFSSRVDRGWVPPSLEDVDAEVEASDAARRS